MKTLSMQETQHLLVTEPAWLTALGARLWVTRDGDPADYVLAPGERLAVGRGEHVTLGGWDADLPAQWEWQPAAAVPARYRLFDRVAGALAALAAFARNAASSASRAHGCIKAGDSIASAGTLR